MGRDVTGPRHVGPPSNGSRLSCGRLARRRKGGGRQSVPRQGHNTPLPLRRSPPVSFKRLLGSAVRGVLASRQCAVLPVTCSVNALRNRAAPVFLLTLVGGPGHSVQVPRAAP